MTYSALTRRLRRLGMQLQRQGRGSYEVRINPTKQLTTVIARHHGREIPPGTLRAILRDLDLTEADL